MDQLNLNFTAATLVVARIEHVTAKPFIEKWHYSRSCPTGQNWVFWRARSTASQYAVADYGIGANMDGGVLDGEDDRPACDPRKSRHVRFPCRKGSKGKALIQLSSFLRNATGY